MQLVERIPRPVINAAKLAGVLLATCLCLFIIVKLFNFFAPFVVAFLIASIIEPLVSFLNGKVRIPRPGAAFIGTVIAIGGVSILVFFIGRSVVQQAVDLFSNLPGLLEDVPDRINQGIDSIAENFAFLPFDAGEGFDTLAAALVKWLTDNAGDAAGSVVSFAGYLPQIMLFVTFMLLSIYFISRDKAKMKALIVFQTPLTIRQKFEYVRDELLGALLGYLRAQLIIMSVNFVIIFIAFMILGIDYALLLSVVIAIVDALPVFGTGLFFIPWAVYSLITGDITMALSIGALWGIMIIARNLLEPRILSSNIGLHPVVTMAAMYIGLMVFGVLGILIGPVTVLILRAVAGFYTKGRTVAEFVFDTK